MCLKDVMRSVQGCKLRSMSSLLGPRLPCSLSQLCLPDIRHLSSMAWCMQVLRPLQLQNVHMLLPTKRPTKPRADAAIRLRSLMSKIVQLIKMSREDIELLALLQEDENVKRLLQRMAGIAFCESMSFIKPFWQCKL